MASAAQTDSTGTIRPTFRVLFSKIRNREIEQVFAAGISMNVQLISFRRRRRSRKSSSSSNNNNNNRKSTLLKGIDEEKKIEKRNKKEEKTSYQATEPNLVTPFR